MSMMEDDAKDLLQRVVWSISAGLVYLLFNITFGIYFGWLFFYDSPTMGNYIFYAWFLLSTAGLLWLLIKWWKRKFPVQ